MEEFLMQDRLSIPDFKSFRYIDINANYDRLAIWTIMRLCIRKQEEDAAKALSRYLKSVAINHLNSFPYSNDRNMTSLMPLFCYLAENEDFPRYGLDDAKEILAKAQLEKGQFKSLQIEYASSPLEDFLTRLNANKIWQYSNTLEFFLNGALQKPLYKAMRPIVAKRAEQCAMAWISGDLAQYEEADKRFRSACKAMNIAHARLIGPAPILADDSSRIRFNSGIDFALFTLGAALWRKDHGQWPASMEDLTPEYLDRSSFASSNFSLFIIDKGIYPNTYTSRGGIGKAIYRAVTLYRKDHNALPVSAEDLRDYAQSPEQLADFAKRFVALDSRPVFCTRDYRTIPRDSMGVMQAYIANPPYITQERAEKWLK